MRQRQHSETPQQRRTALGIEDYLARLGDRVRAARREAQIGSAHLVEGVAGVGVRVRVGVGVSLGVAVSVGVLVSVAVGFSVGSTTASGVSVSVGAASAIGSFTGWALVVHPASMLKIQIESKIILVFFIFSLFFNSKTYFHIVISILRTSGRA